MEVLIIIVHDGPNIFMRILTWNWKYVNFFIRYDYPWILSGEGVTLDTSSLKSLWRWSVHLTVDLRGSRFRASWSSWKKSWIESTFLALGSHSFLGLTVTQLVYSKLLLHRRPHSLFIAFWLVVSLLFGVCNEKTIQAETRWQESHTHGAYLVVFSKCLSVFG